MTNENYLEQVRRSLRESLDFWSNQNKPERERSVLRAFYRCLGVSFLESDLQIGQPEPVDVAAICGRFQITEILDVGRKRHREYGERLQRAQMSESAADLREPWTSPTPVLDSEISELIAERLRAKVAHRDIDALVYVNLRGRFLAPIFRASSATDISELGWRSVSIVFVPYALVLHATAAAPAFLRRVVGTPQNNWHRADGWFEREA